MSGLATRQECFQDLLEKHAGILFRVARTYCRQPEDQADLAQEIRLNLWAAFPKYDEGRSFSTWMYRIALNTAISWVRRAEVRQRPTAPQEMGAARQEDEKAQVLYELIGALDQMNRALLMLYLDDLSYAEIGEVLGISAGNVATRVSRIKQQLRQQVEQGEEK